MEEKILEKVEEAFIKKTSYITKFQVDINN